MPLNEDTSWVHSSSRENKNPDRDLGGIASVFEISPYPMNNLFDNILPAQATSGLIDYRCFYIFNKSPHKYIRNVSITMIETGDGSTVEFGTIIEDEQQKLLITPLDLTQVPDRYGHIIVDVHLGPPLTVYWGTSISTFATNFQAELRKIPMCEDCTVIVSGTWEVTVDFLGEAGSRPVPPIMIIANRLDSTNGGYFRIFPSGTLNPRLCNGDPDETIPDPKPVVTHNKASSYDLFPPVDPDSFPPNSLPPNGPAYFFNKCLNNETGGFAAISYTSLVNMVDRTRINLSTALTYYINNWDDVYIEPKVNDKFIVAVSRVIEGSPINTVAEAIPKDTQSPFAVTFGTGAVSLPWLMPLEGFYLWVKRTTAPGTEPKRLDGFEFTLTGGAYS